MGEGRFRGRCVCVCRRVFLLNEEVVAVATIFFGVGGGRRCWTYLWLSNVVKNLTLCWCLCPSDLCWWPFSSHSLTLAGGWDRGSPLWDSSQLKAAPHPWGVGKRMERCFKGRSTADVNQCRKRSRGGGLQNRTCRSWNTPWVGGLKCRLSWLHSSLQELTVILMEFLSWWSHYN